MRLNEIANNTIKRAVFTFGRLNPPHYGHGGMIDTLQKVAQENNADWYLFVSSKTGDEKNPLTYEQKIAWIHTLFPETKGHLVVDPSIKTPLIAATWLYKQGYRAATFVAGEDDMGSYGEMIKSGNAHGIKNPDAVKAGKGFIFKPLDFAISPRLASATNARKNVTDGDPEAFVRSILGPKINPKLAALVQNKLYPTLRKSLNLESVNEDFDSDAEERRAFMLRPENQKDTVISKAIKDYTPLGDMAKVGSAINRGDYKAAIMPAASLATNAIPGKPIVGMAAGAALGVANAITNANESEKLNKSTPSVMDLAKKYMTDPAEIHRKLAKGVKIEFEHTDDIDIATEIAMDHLGERLDYYSKLSKIENESDNDDDDVGIKIAQAVGGTAGAMLGSELGPFGMAAGAAAGNELGKKAYKAARPFIKSSSDAAADYSNRVMKKLGLKEIEDDAVAIPGEPVSAALSRMNARPDDQSKADFLGSYMKSALDKGGFTNDKFAQHTANLKKKINEVADQPYRYMLAKKTDSGNWYIFETDNGVRMVVSATLDPLPNGTFSTEIAFSEHNAKSMDLTGKGDAFRIFATVGAIVKEFLRSGKPNARITEIYFTGKTNEPSRIKLYDMIAKNINRFLTNFEFKNTVDQGGEKYYHFKKVIAASESQISENFADGKGPGRAGDSQRHGIPKGATIAQLEKAAKAPGRKGQLARWQLNMRRGKKANETVEANINDTWFKANGFKTFKKSNPVKYETAKAAGTLDTLEGPVKYEAGYKIMTGPKGEQYPIPPNKFTELYDVDKEGVATPKKIIKWAKLADHDGVVNTSWGEPLNYTAGNDYIVRHGAGDYGVVKKDIFAQTYIKENTVAEDYKDAAKYAASAHAGQTRSGGKPYISHPVRVANLVRKYKDSKELDKLLSAAFLHDTIEDTDTTEEQLRKMFGDLVATLVKELTSDKEKIEKLGKEEYLTQKMIHMSSWGLVIKLADRLDNVSDIKTAKTPEWRQRYRTETENILTQLEQNRKLSGTHKKIMQAIRGKLAEIDESYVNEVSKVRLSVDPADYGAYVRDSGTAEKIITVPLNKIVSTFEPEEFGKMKTPAGAANVEKIIAGIKRGDKLPPLLVRRFENGYQVLDGHHRYEAYKRMKVKVIPVRVIDPKNIKEADVEDSKKPLVYLDMDGVLAEIDESLSVPAVSEQNISEIPLPEPSHDDLAAASDPKAPVLGSGKEAIVIHDKKDNGVIKIIGDPGALKNNGYMQYVLMSKKYAASNPYLPQVKSIQQVKTQQGTGVLKYLIRMEELTPYGQTTQEERETISRKIFYGDDLEEILRSMTQGVDISEYKIEQAIWEGLKTKIVRDPKFVDVIRLIWKAKQASGANIDVHSANFMVRRTSGEPQLVITDPLATIRGKLSETDQSITNDKPLRYDMYSGISFLDGPVYFSSHLGERLTQRKADLLLVQELLLKAKKEYGNKIASYDFDNSFVIKKKSGPGLGIDKKQQPDSSIRYRVRTYHPDKNVGYIQDRVYVSEETETAQPLVYIDMDGVLADFFSEWSRISGVNNYKDIDDVPAKLELIRTHPTFWIDLPLLPNAKALIRHVVKNFGEYRICSTPLTGDERSKPGKLQWIRTHLNDMPPAEIILTHDKAQFALNNNQPNILIDDFGKNINAWKAAGGMGIKYEDANFADVAKILEKLSKN